MSGKLGIYWKALKRFRLFDSSKSCLKTPSMNSPYRVLFVCMGNICRSPAAECVFRNFVEKSEIHRSIECDSAGTIDFHTGNAPDSRMRSAGNKRGYTIKDAARQVQHEDFEQFDLIITMDDKNFHNVQRMAPNSEYRATVRKFCDYISNFPDTEVPDPYYGGAAGFEHVLDLLEDGCGTILS